MSDRRRVIAAMLIVEHASAEVVGALRRAGIRSILIKGPLQQQWLAAAGRPRSSVDVDLLLDPADIAGASAVMSELGYQLEPEVTPGVEHHAALWSAQGRIPVELHWTLWGTDPDKTWPVLALRTEEAVVESQVVEIPNEPARCLLAALHAAHHGIDEASQYDLRRAITVSDVDSWRLSAELASAIGALRPFVAGLELVPEGARLRVELELEAFPLTERLALNIDAGSVPGAPGFYWLAQQKGNRARFRFVVHKIAPPSEFMRFKYPFARGGTWQLALMYVYRALWMARWAVPGLFAWRRARGSGRKID